MKTLRSSTVVLMVLSAFLQQSFAAPSSSSILHRDGTGDDTKISSASAISSPMDANLANSGNAEGISKPTSISSETEEKIPVDSKAVSTPESIPSRSDSKTPESSNGEGISAPAPISAPDSISAPGSISTPSKTTISDTGSAEKISENTGISGISTPGSISAPSDAKISDSNSIPSPSTTSVTTDKELPESKKGEKTSEAQPVENSIDRENGEGGNDSKPDPQTSLARTHNNDGAPRRSFADALRLIGRSSKLIRKNLPGAQKAYNEGGVLGLADYVVTIPDFWREPPVIGFSNVTVDNSAGYTAVSATTSESLPLNGPPFVFSLENLLPAILENVLEFRTITNEMGVQERVVVLNDRKRILLEANADA